MYRDDLEAALARNADLERRVRELEGARAAPPPNVVEHAAPPPNDVDLDALVHAREHAAAVVAARTERRAQSRREVAIARLARRPSRIRIDTSGGTTRVTIARTPFFDALRAQLPWGFGFAAVNPGVFVVVGLCAAAAGLGWPIWIGGPAWLVLLVAINAAYARLANARWHVDLTASGSYAVHRGRPQFAAKLGRTRDLAVSLPASPDPARLHKGRIGGVAFEALTDRDVLALRSVLASTGVDA